MRKIDKILEKFLTSVRGYIGRSISIEDLYRFKRPKVCTKHRRVFYENIIKKYGKYGAIIAMEVLGVKNLMAYEKLFFCLHKGVLPDIIVRRFVKMCMEHSGMIINKGKNAFATINDCVWWINTDKYQRNERRWQLKTLRKMLEV